MKYISPLLCIATIFILSKQTQANHIIGGEVNYAIKKITNNEITYQITVRLIRDEGCGNCMTLGKNIGIMIVDMDAAKKAGLASKSMSLDCLLTNRTVAGLQEKPRCLVNDPGIYFMAYEYETIVKLPKNKSGYFIYHNACCRVLGISNLNKYSGFAYHTTIPGVLQNQKTIVDNSPVFNNEIALICRDNKFKLRVQATDKDGDSLVYVFANSYEIINYAPEAQPAERIKSTLINHKAEFPFDHPLGMKSNIDPITGEISGLSPETGRYLINVAVRSYRNGLFLNETQKDLIITISECDFPSAILQDSYTVCLPAETLLQNEHYTPLNKTYRWDIMDPDKDELDVQRGETLPFKKKKPGQYIVRLIINEMEPCSDTAFTQVMVSAVEARIKALTVDGENNSQKICDESILTNGQLQKRTWILANDSILSVSKDNSRSLTITNAASFYKNVLLVIRNEYACADTAILALQKTKQKKKKQSPDTQETDFTIYFDLNSDVLTSASKKTLNQFIQYALSKNLQNIRIEGHTDNTGNLTFNQPLSDKRAKRVANYLKLHGLHAIDIVTVGYADTAPIAENETAEGKKRNRRTEIKPLSE